jgi:hypothetical protein
MNSSAHDFPTGAMRPGDARPPRRTSHLLTPYLVAVLCTALTAWLVHFAAQQSAVHDLSGHVETLLPLARLGILTAPLIVAFRAGAATLFVWLVAGAMNDRLALRAVAACVLPCMPLLELPAIVDALAVLTSPESGWAAAHIPLGLDALLDTTTGKARVLAQSLNVALCAWTVLLARQLRARLQHGNAVAVPAALAAATVLVVLPHLVG